jgi:hypothetical protein
MRLRSDTYDDVRAALVARLADTMRIGCRVLRREGRAQVTEAVTLECID